MLQRFVFPATAVVVAVLVLLPILFLLYGSLGTAPPGEVSTLTFRWFIQALTSPRLLDSARLTLVLALGTTVLATLVGVVLAWLVARTDIPARRLLHLGVIAPFFLSPFIGALAWDMLLSPKIGVLNQALAALGLGGFNVYSLGGIIWVMGLYYAPYVYLFVQSALYNFDPALEEAAAMTGFGRWATLRHVTLPLMAPALLSGMLLALVAAAGQFGVPALLGRPMRLSVLATNIYDLTSIYPSRFNLAAALAVELMIIAGVGVYLQQRLLRRRSFVTVGGKSPRARLQALGAWRWPAFVMAAATMLFGTILPLLVLLYASLTPLYTGRVDLLDLTLDHYREVLIGNPLAQRAVVNTLWISAASATIAVLLAVVLSWISLRTRLWYRGLLDLLVTLPAAIPAVALGLALLWTWVYLPLPVYGTPALLVVGYVTGFLPFAVRAILSVHRQIDPALEEAVTMVGGTWLATLRHVTLPLLKPGIAAGWTLLFIIYVRELAISILLYSPGNEVLSVLIFNRWVEGDHGVLAAMAVLQVVMMAIVITAVGKLFRVDLARAAA
jgi:iron(III) transport system permease protein